MIRPIPLVDLRAAWAEIADALLPELQEVLEGGWYVGGPHVASFETEYAAFVGVEHCVGVANGTDAVELALRAARVGVDDEVILPANTFIATAEAVIRAGARPVLVDVDPGSLLIDPYQVEGAIGPATRAVVPVHLYGQMAPVQELLDLTADRGIVVVEDAAQSQGASRHGVGSGAAGHIAATSFYPGKNLGAAGDAGAVTTDNPRLAESVRLLANHGSAHKYRHDVIGFNSRLDAIQAVILRHKLRLLDEWNDRRRRAAQRYREMLAGVESITLPTTADGNDHVWHLFVVQVENRNEVQRELTAAGVAASIHYPTPLHLTGAFAGWGLGPGSFPVAEAAAGRILSLPLYPHITEADQSYVVESLVRAVSRRVPAKQWRGGE